MQNKQKIAKDAMIGEELLVTASKNRSLEGLKGEIIDETRRTIKIRTDKGTKTIIKSGAKLRIGGKDVDGEDLDGRVEERIKN